MRWFRITRAGIPPNTRVALEQRGTETIRTLLLMGNWVLETEDGARFTVDEQRKFHTVMAQGTSGQGRT